MTYSRREGRKGSGFGPGWCVCAPGGGGLRHAARTSTHAQARSKSTRTYAHTPAAQRPLGGGGGGQKQSSSIGSLQRAPRFSSGMNEASLLPCSLSHAPSQLNALAGVLWVGLCASKAHNTYTCRVTYTHTHADAHPLNRTSGLMTARGLCACTW